MSKVLNTTGHLQLRLSSFSILRVQIIVFQKAFTFTMFNAYIFFFKEMIVAYKRQRGEQQAEQSHSSRW